MKNEQNGRLGFFFVVLFLVLVYKKKEKIWKNFNVNWTAGLFIGDIDEVCIHQLPAQRKKVCHSTWENL